MTADPHSVYNALVDHMCAHCNRSVFKKCIALPEDRRCKTKIYCMQRILKRDDEEYPVRLPGVE